MFFLLPSDAFIPDYAANKFADDAQGIAGYL